jgi:hypothetical protein
MFLAYRSVKDGEWVRRAREYFSAIPTPAADPAANAVVRSDHPNPSDSNVERAWAAARVPFETIGGQTINSSKLQTGGVAVNAKVDGTGLHMGRGVSRGTYVTAVRGTSQELREPDEVLRSKDQNPIAEVAVFDAMRDKALVAVDELSALSGQENWKKLAPFRGEKPGRLPKRHSRGATSGQGSLSDWRCEDQGFLADPESAAMLHHLSLL